MKALREQMHLSQAEFAKLIGVSQTCISLYEKGTRKLPAKTIKKIADLQLQLNIMETPTALGLTTRQKRRQDKMETRLKRDIKKAAVELMQLQDVLSGMKEEEAHLLEKQKMVHQLAAHAPPGSFDRGHFEEIETNTLKALEHCDGCKQNILIYKIYLLQASQAAAGALLRGEEPGTLLITDAGPDDFI